MNDEKEETRITVGELGTPVPAKKRRGFAAMDREVARAISKKGGVAAHMAGTAHEFTTEEARVAGRKGGLATHARKAAKETGKETE